MHPEPGAAAGQKTRDIQIEERGECTVFMNPECKDIDPEQFTTWSPDEEITRSLDANGVKQLLHRIEQDDECYTVIGIQEFPFADAASGNKLVGNERKVEREIWVKFQGVDKSLAGEDDHGIFHVHFAGKWNPEESSCENAKAHRVCTGVIMSSF